MCHSYYGRLGKKRATKQETKVPGHLYALIPSNEVLSPWSSLPFCEFVRLHLYAPLIQERSHESHYQWQNGHR
jgi:hypothetical protein